MDARILEIVPPLEGDLAEEGVDTLVLVPDGTLRTVPMAALLDGERFLVQRFALATTYGMTLTDGNRLESREVRALVGDPAPGRFYSLSLLPRLEARELSWRGLVPSGSLLEWIDEMYESPPTVFERTLGKWENVRNLLHTFSPSFQPSMTFKVFGTQAGEPSIHGDFNDTDTCFWRDSFWTDADWRTHRDRCRAELVAPLGLTDTANSEAIASGTIPESRVSSCLSMR